MAWETQTKRTWYLVLKDCIVCDAIVGGQRAKKLQKVLQLQNKSYLPGWSSLKIGACRIDSRLQCRIVTPERECHPSP
jgi:hypothetical protein